MRPRQVDPQLPLALESPRQERESWLHSAHIRSHMPADEAKALDEKAQTQEAVILSFMRANKGQRMTPSEVARAFSAGEGYGWPLTSVRRALTNLSDGRRYNPPLLTHWFTDRRPGPFGVKESTWSFEG